MSTTLYRSPNVIIDAHEWHVLVCRTKRRVILQYRWRPLCSKPGMWRPITQWTGAKPKRLSHYFDKYRLHIRDARESESVRAAAIASLRGPSSAATLANAA